MNATLTIGTFPGETVSASSPLHIACKTGKVDVVFKLIENGADPNQMNEVHQHRFFSSSSDRSKTLSSGMANETI